MSVGLTITVRGLTHVGYVCSSTHADQDTLSTVAWNVHQSTVCPVGEGIGILNTTLGNVTPNSILACGLATAQALNSIVGMARKGVLNQ